MPQKPETSFRNRCVLTFLNTHLKNSTYLSIQQVALLGHPDLVLCVRGKFVAMELKKSVKDKPRPLQTLCLKNVEQAGGIALIVYPENWEEVKLLLQKLDKGDLA